MTTVTFSPLLTPDRADQLRTALACYTARGVDETLGLIGRAALERSDLTGVARALGSDHGATATLIRLFLLGRAVSTDAAAAALDPLGLPQALDAGLVEVDGADVRASYDLRPYAEAGDDTGWWVLSDFGSDVRPGPLAADHVLGIGAAAMTLAQATVRDPVHRALDLGTGSGVQALHLTRHAEQVVATDISTRALRLAATTAVLNGLDWDLRRGSLLEPVNGERFDLIVANPPFVVSPGWGDRSAGGDGSGPAAPNGYRHDYRDSGMAGDAVSRTLVESLPARLNDGGTAQLLANWVITAEQEWGERLGGWLDGAGCDAWVWQREVAEPGEYVSLWLRDAGEQVGAPRWNRQYDDWCDWMQSQGVLAIGMGMIALRRTGSATPVVICEDVPQPLAQPVGPAVAGWFDRAAWLRRVGVDGLLSATLRAEDGLVRSEHALRSADGWDVAVRQLRQAHGLRWELEVDPAVAAVVAGCDGRAPLRVLLGVLAAALDRPENEVIASALPAIEDLLRRGLLQPGASADRGAD